MARQIQLRRGTAEQHEQFIGADGEVTVDTTNRTLRIHDGETPGGVALAKQNDIPTQQSLPDNYDFVIESQLPTAENNYTWYRKYKSGWVEQGGIWTGNMSCGQGQEIGVTITMPIAMSNENYYSNAPVTNLYLFPMGVIQNTNTVRFRFGAYTVGRTLTKFSWTVIGMAS